MIKICILSVFLFTSFVVLAEENPFVKYQNLTEKVEKLENANKERTIVYNKLVENCVDYYKTQLGFEVATESCACAMEKMLDNAYEWGKDAAYKRRNRFSEMFVRDIPYFVMDCLKRNRKP